MDDLKRELFSMACDMQKMLHSIVLPICQEHGLTLQQLHVLVELSRAPGQTSSQLSDRAGILRTNFAGVFRRMEERGLVERRRSDRDRRAYELRVTDKGRALLRSLDGDIRARYGAAFENEPPETFETILAGFRALSLFTSKLGR